MRRVFVSLSVGLFLTPPALLAQTPAQPSPATPSAAQQQQAHDDHGERPSPERIHRFELQTVTLESFEANGYILDIGGGGEGVIGQLKPAQVVAIDLSARELRGAPAGPLKIVMDATDLKFLDDSFPTATSFFTFMYMKPDDQRKAFAELFRVLQPGGRLLVWDVIIPARFDAVKDIAVFPLKIKLPDREIDTGYGTFFPDRPHDAAYFVNLATATGFEVGTRHENGRTFALELRKPTQSTR